MSHTQTTVRFSVLTCWLFFAVASAFAQPADLFEAYTWRAIGPDYTGGRIVDIDVDPVNRDVIYGAAASGGLWKTVNRGTTWQPIFDYEGTFAIGDIAVDQKDGKVIWVGTGEANNQRSSYAGDGLYKSTDEGETWTHVGLRDTGHIGRIVIDPTDSDVVYVAALGHLYSHNDERGVFKTSDGGATWEKVLFISPAVGVVDLVIDPSNPQVLYAASYERFREAWNFDGAGPGSAIYKSSDAGATWDRLSGGLPSGDIGRIGLAISMQNSNRLYATVSNQNLAPQQTEELDSGNENDEGEISTAFGIRLKYEEGVCFLADAGRGQTNLRQGDVVLQIGGNPTVDKQAVIAYLKSIKPGDTVQVVTQRGDDSNTAKFTVQSRRPQQIGGEIYLTEDAGQTWTRVNERPIGGSPAYYYGQIRVDPEDDQGLYLTSVPLSTSTDGGRTWRTIARSTHVDHHALWVDPDEPRRLILGNDGGFHFSYDYGETWDWVNNLPLCQFYAITADQQHPYHVYGGLQDNGSIGGPSQTRGSGVVFQDWYRVGGGDGFYVQVDPNDSNIVFSESQFGAINRLDRSTGSSRGIRPPQTGEERNRYNWNSPILMSPHNPTTIFFASQRLYRSYNRGDNWQAISPDLTTNNGVQISGNVPYCTITTIDQSTHDPNILVVGTDDGKVQLTTDDGETWVDLSGNFPARPGEWWCTRVAFSPRDRNTLLVSFTGYRKDDFRPFVFRSTDLGQTFQSISANLPTGGVNVIKADAKSDDVYWLGNDFGVWVTVDQGASWHALDNELPRAPVHDLLVHSRENDLIIGTHGRGIFIIDDISAIQQYADLADDEKLALFQPRPVTMWRRGGRGGGGISGDRKVVYPNPPRSVPVFYYVDPSGEDAQIELTIENESGDQVAELETSETKGLVRVEWAYAGRGGGRGGRGGRGGGRRGRGGQFGGQGPAGPQIGPGTYWAVLKSGDRELRKKVVLLPDDGN